MLGWMATQVHKNMVMKQLHTMFQIVQQCPKSVQQLVSNEWVDGWYGASINRCSLKQVADEEEKQHGNGQVKLLRRHLSKSISKRWRGAEYTQNTRVAQWPTYRRATNNE